MAILKQLLALASVFGAALAQSSTAYNDQGITFQGLQEPIHDVWYGFVFPPTSATGAEAQEFVGEIVTPVANQWVGIALGGQMADNLLLVAWPNGNEIMSSPRYATGYIQPTPYAGPTITTLKQDVNATHWSWVFRCQNCTSWSGGTMDTNGAPVFAWAISLTAVFDPSNTATDFNEHDDFGFWGEITANAHSDNYESIFNGGTTTSSPTTSSSTTISSPTTTSSPKTTSLPTSTTSSTTTLPTGTPTSSPTTSAPTTTPSCACPCATPYDYIIVGAGPGGLVAADRLSQAGKNVLLLERGGPSTGETGGTDVPPWATGTNLTLFDIPAEFPSMFGSSGPTTWFCDDVDTMAGCLVGGGSSIGAGLYWYPADLDFATVRGWPESWTNHTPFTQMLMERLPSSNDTSPDGIRYLDQSYNVVSSLLAPLGFSNISINSEPNTKENVFGFSDFNFQEGKRWGPVATYLQTASTRRNFKMEMRTMVTALARNGSTITGVHTNNTALGQNGFISVGPDTRVVLSAGAFGTPRILFRSGIGPADMIALVQGNTEAASLLPPASDFIDLPVGMNVQDNPSIELVFTHPSIDSYANWADVWQNPRPADAAQYLKNQTGVLAMSTPKLNFWQAFDGGDGNIRYVQGTVRPGFNSNKNLTNAVGFNLSQAFTITLSPSTNVASRGRIGFTSPALNVGVAVNPWFTNSTDLDTIAASIDQIIDNFRHVENLTLISNFTTLTDILADPQLNNSIVGSNNWVGSCSIGQVVDENALVVNTTNLFVVDASIIPSLTIGNPQGVIMSAAEQAASKMIALASFHDNQVFIANLDSVDYDLITKGSNFVILQWSITSGQTDPKQPPSVGQVLNMANDGSFKFHCGRSASGTVADFWNENFISSESTFNHGAGELNFAFTGTLQLQVQRKSDGVNIVVTLENIGFAQGHSGSTNNWWFGQKGGVNLGDNVLATQGTDGNGDPRYVHFLRGDNAVNDVDIVLLG